MIESYINSVQTNGFNDLSFLWLEITEKCNLECLHCYADSSPRKELLGQMNTEDWFKVIKESAQMGCRQVQFIGGEPTLHPDLHRLISFASSQGYTFIEVFTNSTRINDSLLKTFVEHKVHIATSFYSDDPPTHDKITNRQSSFNRTVNGIKHFVDSGLTVRVGIIEMQENQGHTLRAKKYLEELGISDIGMDAQRGVGRGSRDVRTSNPLEELCGECWKGKLCITSSGKTYPCVFSRFAELGLAKDGIKKILDSEILSRFRGSLRDFQQSIEMPLCSPDRCDPTSSTCGPTNFCTPATSCGPESKCMPGCSPSTQPCQPDTRCAPDYKNQPL